MRQAKHALTPETSPPHTIIQHLCMYQYTSDRISLKLLFVWQMLLTVLHYSRALQYVTLLSFVHVKVSGGNNFHSLH